MAEAAKVQPLHLHRQPPAPAPANSAPTPPPTSTTPVVFENPPPTFSGSSFSGRSWNISAPGGNYPISFTGATDLTVAGDLNKFWLSAAQPGGTVTISGNQNTLVFRTSATPATVTVTGSANTFYLPEGSPIKLEGAGAVMSTIKYYKP